jgi:hypothetical protein
LRYGFDVPFSNTILVMGNDSAEGELLPFEVQSSLKADEAKMPLSVWNFLIVTDSS